MSGNIMNAAVLGMNAQTSWLATISQNIANSSTTGYKDAETEFSSLVNQAGANNYSAGGVTTNSISQNTLQGSVVGGSAVTNLAVQGNGFFVVSNAAGDVFLTRDGSFVPDQSGNLINGAGYYLMGTNVQNGNFSPVANSLAGLQKVNVSKTGEQAVATTSGTLSVNLPSTATVVTTPNASTPATTAAAANYTEKTSLVTYDSLGTPITLDVYMTKIADNPAASAGPPPVAGVPNWQVDVYNHADANATSGGFPYSTNPLVTTTLTFDPTTGQYAGGSPITIPISATTGQTVSLDMSQSTQLAAAYAVNTAVTNGNAPNTLTGVSIATDGTLNFVYSGGSTLPGYKIPLATVASPDSLTAVNGTVYSTNANSGQPQVGVAGTSGFGSIQSDSIESSTVDLATELTQMIQAQSGYEANSKVFQTGANLLSILNKLQA
jgi:flagellar hook protein FlgE